MEKNNDGLFSNKFLLWLILLSLPGSAAVFEQISTIIFWVAAIVLGIFIFVFILAKLGQTAAKSSNKTTELSNIENENLDWFSK